MDPRSHIVALLEVRLIVSGLQSVRLHASVQRFIAETMARIGLVDVLFASSVVHEPSIVVVKAAIPMTKNIYA